MQSFACSSWCLNHCAYFNTFCGVVYDWPSLACTRTHTDTRRHTHRVPVDNVGNWVLGCCFRLTDSSPSLLILFSYTSPPHSVSLSFHLCLWFSDTTGIDLCRSEYVVWAAHSNWNCTITLLSLATQCEPPLHPATHSLLPASCLLLPALLS